MRQQQKTKVGRVDTKRVDRYNIPVNERADLKFAITNVKITKASLMVADTLISMVSPQYEDNWWADDRVPLEFFGPGVLFRRGLLDCGVMVVLEVERDAKEDSQPSLMIGHGSKSLTWEMIGSDHYVEEVCIGGKTKSLCYHRGGCGYIAIHPEREDNNANANNDESKKVIVDAPTMDLDAASTKTSHTGAKITMHY